MLIFSSEAIDRLPSKFIGEYLVYLLSSSNNSEAISRLPSVLA